MIGKFEEQQSKINLRRIFNHLTSVEDPDPNWIPYRDSATLWIRIRILSMDLDPQIKKLDKLEAKGGPRLKTKFTESQMIIS